MAFVRGARIKSKALCWVSAYVFCQYFSDCYRWTLILNLTCL